MSDDMAAPEMEGTEESDAAEAAKPALAKGAPLGARGARPGMRPPGAGRPPGVPMKPAGKPSRLKGFLMLGIILAVVGLSGAIGWRLVKRFLIKDTKTVDIGVEIDKAFDRATEERKQIELIEKMVTTDGKDLGGAEAVQLQKHLQGLQECTGKFDDLRALMRDKQQEALKKQKAEAADAIAQSSDNEKLASSDIKVKLWVLDAMDLLEFSKHAPEYGGLYIPMFRALDLLRKSQADLKVLGGQLENIISRNDAAEKAKTRAKIEELKAAFSAVRDKLNALDTYVKDGLARPELSPKDIKELEELHEKASEAQMSFKETQRMRLLIPE